MVRAPTSHELYDILSAVSDRLCSFMIRGEWEVPQDESIPKEPIVLKTLASLTISTEWDSLIQQILCMCRFPSLVRLVTPVSIYGILQPQLMRLLTDEPRLFQSVKHLIIEEFVRAIPMGMFFELRSAFPQVDHVQFTSYLTSDSSLAIFLASSWAPITRLDLQSADLTQVAEMFFIRVLKGFHAPLRELNIDRVYGPLYRDDYERIRPQVERFTILEVQPHHPYYTVLHVDAIPFEERLLIAQKPAEHRDF